MRQIGLQPAGCQLWNSSCAASGTQHFAYCSTLVLDPTSLLPALPLPGPWAAF
jgi:hypothetical protein